MDGGSTDGGATYAGEGVCVPGDTRGGCDIDIGGTSTLDELISLPVVISCQPSMYPRPMAKDELPVRGFASAAAFGAWLEKQHAKSAGIWLEDPEEAER